MKKIDKVDLLLFIIYKLLLDFIYIKFQYNLYSYYGFGYSFDFVRFIIGWLVFLVCAFICQSKDKTITTTFIYTLFLLSITPCIIYYEYNQDTSFWMVGTQCVCLLFLRAFFMLFGKEKSTIKFNRVRYDNLLLQILTYGLLGTYFVICLIRYGVPSLSSFLFSNVYDTRETFAASNFFSIAQNLICKIVVPLILVVSIRDRKWISFIFVLILQLYSYGITGFKTYLFIPAVIIGVSIFPKFDLKKCIAFGMPSIVLLSLLAYLITKDIMIYAIFIERVIFLPAKIKMAYFDFFSTHEFAYFSQSSIGKIFGITSVYSENIPNMIGRIYWNKPNMWTNTGFMADAYSNAGFVGMICMSFILGIAILLAKFGLSKVPDNLSKGIQAVFLLFFISLNDGGAISILVSGGMLVLIILIVVICFDKRKPSLEREKELSHDNELANE